MTGPPKAYTYNPAGHASTTVTDTGAGTTAGATLGLASSYQESNAAGTTVRKDYTWVQDGVGRPYVGSVLTTLDPGASFAAQSKSAQTLDIYGNMTQSQVFDYGSPFAPARTYNYTYLTDTNYTSRYIRNRLTLATVTSSLGTITLVQNCYDYADGPCGGAAGGPSPASDPPAGFDGANTQRSGGRVLHDDTNYGSSFIYRGNPTRPVSMGTATSLVYDLAGVVWKVTDGSGKTVDVTADPATGYTLPTMLAPDGAPQLGTTVTYSSSWGVKSIVGPNGATSTTTSDAYGRPETTTIPDGATTSFGYTQVTRAATQTQAAPLTGTRFTKTTVDGFSRTVKVESGHDTVTDSVVDTVYGPCACSPLGKMLRVSQPYAPGGTPVWTTNTYDASGRTLTVTAADSASVTRYTYQGNQTTVTDPAGKWKTMTSDAMGNLVTVTEPDPALGTDVTSYTYNAANQLLTVTMPRSNGTQTRTFVWQGSDMASATNPENGTVNYTYDGAHRVLTRTDAKGQQTQYSYNTYGQQTTVRYFVSGVEQTSQRVDYTNSMSSGTIGLVTSVTFGGGKFAYLYGYSPTGHMTRKRLRMFTGGSAYVDMEAQYEWDTDGKMIASTLPGTQVVFGGGILPTTKYLYFYDVLGRLNSMTQTNCMTQTVTSTPCAPNNGSTVATATYGVAGEMTGLTYNGYTETRTYNSMLQMTRQTVTSGWQTAMDMQYTFSGTQNNGRITQSTDGVSGETVVYTYDTLNRLTKAETTSAAWGDAYTYDGFGNLTAKTVTKGTAPSMSATYDPATNRQVGLTYDANGNTGGTYDVENRLVQSSTGGPQWSYDPSGKRVFALTPGNGSSIATTCEIYFYGLTGQKTTYHCGYNDQSGGDGTFWFVFAGANQYFGKKLMAVTDRLGSVRVNASGQQMNYFPYGEERTSTADGQEKFGTYFRDPGGVDYADQRYYASASGRFLTPDPSRSSSDASDPQSWNRYAYVLRDPVNRIDPTGLDGRCGWVYTGEIFAYIPCPGGPGGPNDGPQPIVDDQSPTPGPQPTGPSQEELVVRNAAFRASDRLFQPDCAGLFLAPWANTLEQRRILSGQLQYLIDQGDLRLLLPQYLPPNTSSSIPAFTTGTYGFIYVVDGSSFFTNTLNGQPLGGAFSGLTLAQTQELIIIHELLHWLGIGADTAGQRNMLANGDIVTGSTGLSDEVRKKCF